MKYQLLIIFLLGLSIAPVGSRAGATDISGTWVCTIDQKDDDGPMKVTFVFKQEGEKLTGAYSDAVMRDLPITGAVKGDKVAFSYELKPPAGVKKPGGGITIRCAGVIESPTRMTGTLPAGSPYCSAGCKWTAAKKK